MIETTQTGRVCRITLNRPEKRNALCVELCRRLVEALNRADSDRDTGAILLTANGPAFCAGMDLDEVRDKLPRDLGEIHESLFTTINRIRKPLIAAIQGASVAGGTGLAANAHVVIAAPGARFGLTEIRIGLWPVLIFRAVAMAIGERRATELSLTGRIIEAEEALRFGLVTEISEDPEQRAMEIATTVAGYSSYALHQGLEYVQQIRHAEWEHGGKLGRAMRNRLMAGPDFKEGLKAFFEERARR